MSSPLVTVQTLVVVVICRRRLQTISVDYPSMQWFWSWPWPSSYRPIIQWSVFQTFVDFTNTKQCFTSSILSDRHSRNKLMVPSTEGKTSVCRLTVSMLTIVACVSTHRVRHTNLRIDLADDMIGCQYIRYRLEDIEDCRYRYYFVPSDVVIVVICPNHHWNIDQLNAE